MSGKVLFVDDQPELLAGIAFLLQEQGIEVETHTSAITLPLVVRTIDPDLILLDLNLPALSGSSFLKRGRSRLRIETPVVLFSGRAASELAKETEALGADGFIAKSEEPIDIVSRIQSWIAQSRAVRAIAQEQVA